VPTPATPAHDGPSHPDATPDPAGRRDCAHPRAARRHGTRTAYVADRCRCPDCRRANRDASAARTRAIAFGRWTPFVDAEPARAHIHRLRAAGAGIDQIVTRAGVASGTVRALVYGDPRTGKPVERIRPETEARLLTVGPDLPAAGALVDATGTVRRLQALVAAGWAVSLLAGHLGRRPASVRATMTRARVTAATAAEVALLYARLEHAGPPETTPADRSRAATARAQAAARGWAPPPWWDDIDSDPAPVQAADPGDARIDDVAVERAMVGEPVALNPDEQAEAVRRLTARGLSVRRIADRLCISERTVSRRRGVQVA
jgi:hypothetical protein